MKGMKKLISALLAVVMMLMMTITGFAADTGYTVTINDGDVSGASYAAYKLMDVTTGTDGSGTTTFAYTVNSKYSSVLQTLTGQTTDNAIIEYIQNLSTDSDVRKFADELYKKILEENLTADQTAANNEFSNMSGYYLIVETAAGTTSSGTDNESYSLAILRTVYEDETITTKEDVPELTKEVWETNDSVYTNDGGEWQDAADYDIGDEVPFRLSATISEYFDDYDEYALTFHDTLSAGLTFNSTSVRVYVVNGNTETQLDAADYTIDENPTDGCSFEVTVTDLKNLQTSVNVIGKSVIRVEYTAELNDNAVIGQGVRLTNQGNPNVAYLEYSNNPYDKTKTGKTPEDKVTVFTFELDVTKIDDAEKTLNGAGFTLYKWNATGSGASDGSWVKVGNEIVGTNSKPISSFTWTGLDSGEYKIVETTVPEGYTKANDILFTVAATYDTSSDNPRLTALSVIITSGSTYVKGGAASSNLDTGKVNMSIINTSGNSLPSTGGIGTTIFYVLGGIMAIGAATLLITKKRMGRAK